MPRFFDISFEQTNFKDEIWNCMRHRTGIRKNKQFLMYNWFPDSFVFSMVSCASFLPIYFLLRRSLLGLNNYGHTNIVMAVTLAYFACLKQKQKCNLVGLGLLAAKYPAKYTLECLTC
jgi:hypothetical protein